MLIYKKILIIGGVANRCSRSWKEYLWGGERIYLSG
jgi:hypothetical protein